jgi:hypothetical protein
MMVYADSSSIAQWRSETIVGLTSHKSFAKEKKSCADGILRRGADFIRASFPTTDSVSKIRAELKHQFLDAALDLQLAMCTSITRYQIGSDLKSAENGLFDDRGQDVTYRDFATWGTLKNPDYIESDLCELYPALYRLDDEGRMEEVLASAMIVVTLDPAMLRSERAKQRPSSVTVVRDMLFGESVRPYQDSDTYLKHSQSEVNLPRRYNEPSPPAVKVRSDGGIPRRSTADGKRSNHVTFRAPSQDRDERRPLRHRRERVKSLPGWRLPFLSQEGSW